MYGFRRVTKPLALLVIAALFLGFGCKGESPEIAAAAKPVTIQIWGVFDDQDAYSQIIADYKIAHPYASVVYKKFRPEEYERELLNALAEDRGPDVFMMHNTWVQGYRTKIAPLPKSVNIAELVIKGTVKKEQVYELHAKPSVSVRQFQSAFPDQVVRDAVISEKTDSGTLESIAGLPLSVDTLALYWNRPLLNAAGVSEPPKTWTDFQNVVKKITKADAQGEITQSGAALGSSQNVERSTDILSLLMMQNGAIMTDENGFPTFEQMPPGLGGRDLPPGTEAAIFYTDFANPNKEVYTWSEKQPSSLDAFVTGKTAMFFGYSWHLPLIRARAPKLKFGIAPATQTGELEKNFANYWLYTVSKKSKHQNIAWDFIQFMTAEKEAKKYLETTKRPTALRSLIPSQAEDVDLGVFANQILTSESWYRGADVEAAEKAMSDLIDALLAGEKPQEAINTASDRVSQTILPKSQE